MILAKPPTDEIRLAQRASPNRFHVMRQDWRDLLFLHWQWDPEEIQQRLPPGLWVDVFEERAWIGVTPFFMHAVRARCLPALPGVSDFLELNVRTYVYDQSGRPGVWFFSLNANSVPAVFAARTLLGLPYYTAEMGGHRPEEGPVSYSCRRHGERRPSAYEYRRSEPISEPLVGSLEFFLIERYLLYSYQGKRLHDVRVNHRPYPLFKVDVQHWDDAMLRLDGFTPRQALFDHAVYSPGVDVEVYPPCRV